MCQCKTVTFLITDDKRPTTLVVFNSNHFYFGNTFKYVRPTAADTGLTRRESVTTKVGMPTYQLAVFSTNCIQMNENGPKARRVSLAFPLGSSNR